jgi:RNA polymerase sigma-70 factor (ECF subfamily)
VEVTTDAEAIAASVDEPDRFVVIFDRHVRAVYVFLARRYGADAAADLASETFSRAFERRARYRPDTPTALPWLLGIGTRVAANERRREARRFRAYAAAAEPAGHGELSAPGGEVIALLARLKRGDRDAFLLLVWGELAYDEIAAALEIPLGTVRSRIHRARQQLREALSAPPDGDPKTPEGSYNRA